MSSMIDQENIDFEAVYARYRQERDKRLRADGEGQFLDIGEEVLDLVDVDPYSDPVVREPVSEAVDVLILGGGLGGLMAAVNVKAVNVDNFRIIDMAGDFGGVWYWNRYPGVQCDIDAYCYLPLLEEVGYIPQQKYAHGKEIYEHCQRIARHYDLYDHALFGTQITALRWDQDLKRWRVSTNKGDDIQARFVILAAGNASRIKLPNIPGITSFKGAMFHTSRWDYDYTGGDASGGLTKLADKKVAIIGTGATAIQCVPHLGRWAKHLYVFQRTPSVVDERGNRPTDPEWVSSLTPGWSEERRKNFNHVMSGRPFEVDLIQDGWTVLERRLAEKLAGVSREALTADEIAKAREIEDLRRMNELRDRVDRIVTNKDTAEALKGWYRWGCKRPTFNDDYLPTFNRDNVTLVDVSATKGVERITERGIVANGIEYEVDCIILSTGFEITSDMRRRLGIPVVEGRGGVSLYDHWNDGFRTLHGFMTHGFPNQFHTGFTQAGLNANYASMIAEQTEHICYIIQQTIARGAKTVEATAEAETGWAQSIRNAPVSEANRKFLADCTPGYFNNEGNAGRVREFFAGGIEAFNQLLADWREKGDLEGLELGE